jgi:hypothetical protein
MAIILCDADYIYRTLTSPVTALHVGVEVARMSKNLRTCTLRLMYSVYEGEENLRRQTKTSRVMEGGLVGEERSQQKNWNYCRHADDAIAIQICQ